MRIIDNSREILSDKELLEYLKRDDQRAFEVILARYRVRLLAVALNRLENVEDAEECVQDVFVNLWQIRNKLDLTHSLNTYLSAAIKNRVFDFLAKQYRKGLNVIALEESMAYSSSADADMLYREMLTLMNETLQSLPEKCQIVFRMSKFEGKSNTEIAYLMDISTKSVESYLTRAKKEVLNKITLNNPLLLPVALIQLLSIRK